MIYGSHWGEVLDPAWLNSPTMLTSLRRQADRQAKGQLLPGPERVIVVPDAIYLVYPVAVQR